MLESYYDFVLKYIDSSNFQYVCIDTDSTYMAIANSFENLVCSEKRVNFYRRYNQWFPAKYCKSLKQTFIQTQLKRVTWNMPPCCKKVYEHELRTPGFFNKEFSGKTIVVLNSKTYICQGVSKAKKALKK